jgi:hypothetical protein
VESRAQEQKSDQPRPNKATQIPCWPQASCCGLTSTLRVVRSFDSPVEFCRRCHSSSAFAAGQVKRQVTPEDGKSRSTVPSRLRATDASMTMVSNPRRSGGDTTGPSHSIQLIMKASPPVGAREAPRASGHMLRHNPLHPPATVGTFVILLRMLDASAAERPLFASVCACAVAARRAIDASPTADCRFLWLGQIRW